MIQTPDIGIGTARRPATAAHEVPAPVVHFAPAAPTLAFERILRIQGYSDLTKVRPVIRSAAEQMAALATKLSEPRVAYRRVAVRTLEGAVLEVEGGARMHCQAFARQLAGCTHIVPFVLTLGAAIPRQVIELVDRGDLLEGLLMETAGWLAIEDATRQFKARLREESLARGMRMTSRMGPGYSYKIGGRMHEWSLEEHPALFALFGEAQLPVTLMASCAMNPKMSRSGLYGIAPAAPSTSGAPVGGRPVTEST